MFHVEDATRTQQMKAVTAALTKNSVSNAEGRSFRRAFLGIAAETKFSLQVSRHQVVR